jgi:hypothetical protein
VYVLVCVKSTHQGFVAAEYGAKPVLGDGTSFEPRSAQRVLGTVSTLSGYLLAGPRLFSLQQTVMHELHGQV